MVFSEKKNYARWLIITSSLLLLGLFIWNIILFFNQLKKEERLKMEIWVDAQKELLENSNSENSFSPILLSIIQKNTSTPMILYSVKDKVYNARNISATDSVSQEALQKLSLTFAEQYTPIEIYHDNKLYEIVYYGNSSFIKKTKFFPLIIISVVVLFLLALYYFYKISKSNEQNQLWAGMAKETAHQIGTPLSSLVGWIELLKTEHVDPDYIIEMEKDVNRLNTITERFSKIGSVPKLETADLVATAASAFAYLESRSSKLIQFSLDKPNQKINVDLNEQLLSWTIENLVKNAADATRGKGKINLHITADNKWAYLRISDTGKGIAKKDFRTIFKPGVTSKKRGWGLGLSLAKRIVEQYHNGYIKVLKSELGKGTTFEIKLRRSSSRISSKPFYTKI